MGSGWHGHFPATAPSKAESRTLTENLNALVSEFPLSPGGYFGVAGLSKRFRRIRNIYCRDPIPAAQKFFSLACEKAESLTDIRGRDGALKGHLARMRDGTLITFRWRSSSDGTPAVDINIEPGGAIKRQKIHFVKKEAQ